MRHTAAWALPFVFLLACQEAPGERPPAELEGGGGAIVLPACDDGVRNNTESDIDCGGGLCPACQPGQSCNDDADCENDFCSKGAAISRAAWISSRIKTRPTWTAGG